jgi:transposase
MRIFAHTCGTSSAPAIGMHACISAVIPEPSDQIGHSKRRGPRGGRPPAFDAADYRGRNVVERGFCNVKQWRGLATRYDKLARNYRAAAILLYCPGTLVESM